ncbi:helix-turn-helix domain-containing protein [Nocardia sp. NPDC005998]|uniref:helix-turn-helix domain-containing protein n=1 Tax=Nocardia sp. NPDC005998 TaxID=3156894 RepID=UPI00339F210B
METASTRGDRPKLRKTLAMLEPKAAKADAPQQWTRTPLAVAIARRKRGESVTAIAKHLEIGRSTLYRALESHFADTPTA